MTAPHFKGAVPAGVMRGTRRCSLWWAWWHQPVLRLEPLTGGYAKGRQLAVSDSTSCSGPEEGVWQPPSAFIIIRRDLEQM